MMIILVDIIPGIHTMQVSEVVSWKEAVRYLRHHSKICVLIMLFTIPIVPVTLLRIWLNNVEYRHYTVPPAQDTQLPIWHNSAD